MSHSIFLSASVGLNSKVKMIHIKDTFKEILTPDGNTLFFFPCVCVFRLSLTFFALVFSYLLTDVNKAGLAQKHNKIHQQYTKIINIFNAKYFV